LWDGTIKTSIKYTADNQLTLGTGSGFTWTGLTYDDNRNNFLASSGYDCEDWTISTKTKVWIGQFKSTDEYFTDKNWASYKLSYCNAKRYLYCVQTAKETPASCPSGEDLCNGACVDTSADLDNCGGCGTTCSTEDSCSRAICSGSVCGTEPTTGNGCLSDNNLPGICNAGTCEEVSTFSCLKQADCADDEYCLIEGTCVTKGTGGDDKVFGDADCSGEFDIDDVAVFFGTIQNGGRAEYYEKLPWILKDPCL